MIESFALKLTEPIATRRPTDLFCKALGLYTIIKVFFTWTIASDITAFHRFSQPKAIWSWMIFGPAAFGASHINIFLIILLIIAIVTLIVRPNYLTAIMMAWLAFNFYRLTFPISNGSDQILVTLLFLSVPLSSWPIIKAETSSVLQSSLYNTGLLMCKLYVASIYLISGLDKLTSEAWRSGDAFMFISNLDYILNPNLASWIPESAGGRLVLSWLTILFELSFPVLIWFSRIRLWVCVLGAIFHVTIGLFLSLPDFAGIMIVSYLIFFTDDDYKKVKSLIKFN